MQLYFADKIPPDSKRNFFSHVTEEEFSQEGLSGIWTRDLSHTKQESYP